MNETLPNIPENSEKDFTPEDMLMQVDEAFAGVVNQQLPGMERRITELDQRLKQERNKMIADKLVLQRDDLIGLRDRLIQQRQQYLEEIERILKVQNLEPYRRERHKKEN